MPMTVKEMGLTGRKPAGLFICLVETKTDVRGQLPRGRNHMSEFPEKFVRLHQGEEFVRATTIETVTKSDDLLLHLAHLIHRIAGIRERAWNNRLELFRDWLLTPLSGSGQNLPCPPPMTITSFHSPCQTSARRRSPPRSMVARSVPMAVCFSWPARTSALA